jgi:origin recognition complex subunit 6
MHVPSWLVKGRAMPYNCVLYAADTARSKKRFNLPAIVSRPPCPPRIYKKLYTYLSSVLPASDATREPQTPSKKSASATASTRATPKTPLSGRKTPRSTRKPEGQGADVPEWVMSAIRTLVRAFDISSAAPHVFTGVESVLPLLRRMTEATAETPSKRPRKLASQPASAVSDARVLGLIAVVFLYVFTKIKDVEVTPDQYKEWRETAVETLLESQSGDNITYDEISFEAEELMPMAQVEGWLQMEWFLNVMPQEDSEPMEGVELSSVTPGKRTVNKTGGSDYIGLGTMMQDATDYLGGRQREDFKEWKAKIMARVQEIETN